MNRQIILKSRPRAEVRVDNFDLVETDPPVANDGDLIVKAKYFSVDPYMRGRMNEGRSYIAAFEIDRPIAGGTVAEVMESKDTRFNKGDIVMGMLAWQEYQAVKADAVQRIDNPSVPPEYYLGILGMPGLTAYFGLTEVGKPIAGETFIISGAAGAVGMVAGQIAHILGCHVVGIAGSDEKIKYLRETLHFDDVINYKWERNLGEAVARACPKGVDVYYDNVGGVISEAVLNNINTGARIIICGQISQADTADPPTGPRPQPILLNKSALMQGFSSTNFASRFPEGLQRLTTWLNEGKLIYRETIIQGFENLPQALIGLFHGANTGKLLVEI